MSQDDNSWLENIQDGLGCDTLSELLILVREFNKELQAEENTLALSNRYFRKLQPPQDENRKKGVETANTKRKNRSFLFGVSG